MSTAKESVYENTNGFPMASGKNLHMDVSLCHILIIN